MSIPYRIEMRVEVRDVGGRDVQPPLVKTVTVEPMKAAGARAWATRNFNRLLKECGPETIVSASFWGQQIRPPHSTLSGDLSGVNGVERRRTGIFEKW